jgi:hypothetical protein
MFTGRQQGFYRMLVEKAWRAHAAREKIHADSRFAKDQWYRCVLLDTCGIYTTKEASNTTDFDALMLAFAEIAGDDYWIKRMAGAAERRWRWMIAQKMSAKGLTMGCNDKRGEHYIQSIMKHMGLDQLKFADLPAEHLKKIFIALDEDYQRHHKHDRELAHNG